MAEFADSLAMAMGKVVNTRRWKSEPLPEADLERLLTVFDQAPSVTQPWDVQRLDSQDSRRSAVRQILEPLTTRGTEGAQAWLLEAPIVLVGCLELRRATARTGEGGRVSALLEIGGALQNFRLMAHARRLCTAVVREFNPDAMRSALGLPWFLEPVALIAVGYSDARLEHPPRYSLADFYGPHASLPVAEAKDAQRDCSDPYTEPHSSSTPAGYCARVRAIYERRSVRKFTGEPVSSEVLAELLSAAVHAPSGGNMQPWEFVVLEDPEMREAAVETTYAGFYSGPGAQRQTWLLDAGLLVAICVNERRTAGRYGEKLARLAIIDTAAAVQNMLIAATELGLGTCWVGVNQARLAAVLGLPSAVEVVGLVACGRATESPMPRHRMDPGLVTHRNRWGTPFFPAGQPTGAGIGNEGTAQED